MTRPIARLGTVLAIVALASSCQHNVRHAAPPVHSDVSYQVVPDKTLGHYKLTPGQGVVGAEMANNNPPPLYPPNMIAAHRKDVEIQALLIVGRDGHVHEVRIAGNEAHGEMAPFALAVAIATLNWQFTPLRITTWQDMPDGSSKRIDSKPEPFSQRYQFRFTIVDGKPEVTTAKPDAAA